MALRAVDTARANRAAAPRLRLAMAGLGLVGQRHAAAIAAAGNAKGPGVELVAVADPSEASEDLARTFGAVWFETLEEMLATTEPDGVILATPTRLHVPQAMACVRAGLPVLVEKPVSDDPTAAERLVAAAEQAGTAILVGHHRRHNPLIRNAKAMIAAGELGDIRALHATCWFYKPDSYFDAAAWRTRAGAGPVSVNLIHDIDLLRHLCGEVTRVQAQAAPSRRGFETEDVAAALLTFANGAIGTITVSDSIVAPWSWEMTARENPIYPATHESAYLIGGSHGSLSIPDQRLWTHAGARDWWTPMSATTRPTDASDPLVAQIAHFADVIQGKEAPLVSGAEGLQSLRVVDAIQRAAASGTAVTLDPPHAPSQAERPDGLTPS